MTTFKDIFKSSFIENIYSLSILDMVIAMGLSFLLGLFIFFIYKKCYSGVMYSDSFGVTLIALSLITTILIMAISSNVVLSLGMVGALSIVRFRAAIKEPMDIAFLFWSIANGIVLAAGLIPLAVLGTALIGIVLLLFSSSKAISTPYILIVHCEESQLEADVKKLVEKEVLKSKLKSKCITNGTIELNYEVRLHNDNADFLNTLDQMKGVSNVVLVSYNGDYMG